LDRSNGSELEVKQMQRGREGSPSGTGPPRKAVGFYSIQVLPITRSKDPLDLTNRKGTLVWQHEKGVSPWDFYEMVETLSSTSSTVIYLVRKRGVLYAMKSHQQGHEGARKAINNERDKLKLVDHPNVVTVRRVNGSIESHTHE
jgi:hypothetical protein